MKTVSECFFPKKISLVNIRIKRPCPVYVLDKKLQQPPLAAIIEFLLIDIGNSFFIKSPCIIERYQYGYNSTDNTELRTFDGQKPQNSDITISTNILTIIYKNNLINRCCEQILNRIKK